MKDQLKKLKVEYFSGKSWMFSIKFQIIYDCFNKKIVDIFADNGKVHDFQILKNSNL
ncbi:hypothetical protein SAP269_20710 [Spiroplasma ixodetis]|uniref:Transposase n=1 Tax=Spiroplasma ixodetis TaxID=2141 RepID=A0ABM8JQ72_9MOLU